MEYRLKSAVPGKDRIHGGKGVEEAGGNSAAGDANGREK